jgi:hypothetical protein
MGRLGEIAFFVLLIWLFFPSLARLLRAAAGLSRPVRPGPAADGGSAARGGSAGGAPPGPAPAAEPQILVRCPRCGVYFPRSRGLAGRPSTPGALFCSEGCRQQGAAAPS